MAFSPNFWACEPEKTTIWKLSELPLQTGIFMAHERKKTAQQFKQFFNSIKMVLWIRPNYNALIEFNMRNFSFFSFQILQNS